MSKLTSGVILLQKVDKDKKRQARTLRKKMTKSETTLWEHLRNRKLNGLKFRRQQIIKGFIVDFFCHESKLVIEIDGEIHNNPEQKEIDKYRRNVFALRGLKEIRFKNEDVFCNIYSVLNKIKSYANE